MINPYQMKDTLTLGTQTLGEKASERKQVFFNL